jgi:hypothetical protein
MAVYYPWFVFVHLLGLVLFLASHGFAMWAAFQLRSVRDRETIVALLATSTRSTQVAYLGLLLIGVGGLGAGAVGDLLTAPWVVASYVVVVVVLLAMFAIAAPFYYPLRDALVGKDGSPIDDVALFARLDNRRPEILALVGGLGLVVLVGLMVLKPG